MSEIPARELPHSHFSGLVCARTQAWHLLGVLNQVRALPIEIVKKMAISAIIS